MRSEEEKVKLPILVAEDDPDDRMLLGEALDEFKDLLDVHYVDDGVELMEFLHKREPRSPQPKLIFLDLNMPRKDGRQALREIKQDDRLKEIPVVVWTTSNMPEDARLCSEIGADCYYTKPSGFDELNTTVMDILKKYLQIRSRRGEGQRAS